MITGRDVTKTMTTKKKVLIGIAGVLLAAAAAGYGAAAYYYNSHFYSHTEINGTDYGEMTVAQVKDGIEAQMPSYQITIQERNGQKERLTGAQLQLTYQDDGEIDELMEHQQSWAWVVHAFTGVHVQLKDLVAVNEDALKQAVEGLNCMQPENMQAPEDAYVGTTDDGYAVIPEVEGTTLDEEKVIAGLRQALTDGETIFDLEAGDCYEKPEILQDNEELKAKADAINQKLSASLTLDFGTDRQEVLDKSTLKDWVVEKEDGNYAIDETKVTEYVAGLAKKYDTVDSKRSFTTTSGETVTLTPGDYGWEIDQANTEANLMSAINDGAQGNFEIVYTSTALSRDANDIGNSYVELSLEDQHFWVYVEGKQVLDSEVVTGCKNKGTETPKGVYKVKGKTTDYTMRGTKDDSGKWSYEVHCNYWIPFAAENTIGFHDLVTRSDWSSTAYINNGSHGCVNTPLDKVEELYNIVSYKFPVVVY